MTVRYTGWFDAATRVFARRRHERCDELEAAGPPALRAGSVMERCADRSYHRRRRDENGLDGANVLAARTLRALTLLEHYRLAFAEAFERRALACRLMEEILLAVVGQNETKSLVTDEALDRTVDC